MLQLPAITRLQSDQTPWDICCQGAICQGAISRSYGKLTKYKKSTSTCTTFNLLKKFLQTVRIKFVLWKPTGNQFSSGHSKVKKQKHFRVTMKMTKKQTRLSVNTSLTPATLSQKFYKWSKWILHTEVANKTTKHLSG